METRRFVSRGLVLSSLLMASLSTNAGSIDNPVDGTFQDDESAKVHVAFAGGGWRAHSGHSAWVIAALSENNHKLDQAFENVGTFASNSGGSWFNTMLAYSKDFAQAIQSSEAKTNWGLANESSTGWLGQQEYLFNQAPCHDAHGTLFALCVAAHYTGGPIDATYWHKIVDKVVFKHNQTQANLNSKRNSWAKDKSLILAATMLTNEVVVGEYELSAQYYQACNTPAHPKLDGKKGALCQGTDVQTSNPDLTPVAFTSLARDSTLKPLPFFSATRGELESKQFNIGYSSNSLLDHDSTFTTLHNPSNTDQVPIITAAASSSAATGFAASHAVTGNWLESYIGSDEPITYSLSGGLKHINANGMNSAELADKKVVQISDGGAADNSGVAHLVKFLQQNANDNEFNIVAFDNVQTLYLPNGDESKRVGIDIANLFGKGLSPGNKICSGQNGSGTCVLVPNLQIFETEALDTTPVKWSAQAATNSKNLRNDQIETWLLGELLKPSRGFKVAQALQQLPEHFIVTNISFEISKGHTDLINKQLLFALKLHPSALAQETLQNILRSKQLSPELKQELASWLK